MRLTVLACFFAYMATSTLFAQDPLSQTQRDLLNKHLAETIKLMRLSDLAEAEESLNAAEKIAGPSNPGIIVLRSDLYAKRGEFEKAISLLRNEIEKASKAEKPNLEVDLGAKNTLAWLLAVAPDEKLRNGKEARKIAKELASKYKRHQLFDTLAAAHAECGEFELAVKHQQEAIQLADMDPVVEVYKSRLATYRAKKAYRLPEKEIDDLF